MKWSEYVGGDDGGSKVKLGYSFQKATQTGTCLQPEISASIFILNFAFDDDIDVYPVCC